jgi:hypothetical protein
MTANITVTANFDGPPSELIFSDGFESGSLLAWTANTNDAGDLSVTTAAALAGSYGMRALIDDANAIFVRDDMPAAETHYRARFSFDPNSIPMASGEAHFIFKGFSGTTSSYVELVRVELHRTSTSYEIRASLVNDGTSWVSTGWVPIQDRSNVIGIDWQAATAAGANNGGLTLSIDNDDGVQQAATGPVDNDTRRIDFVRLGALNGIDTGTRGTYFFDGFESWREGGGEQTATLTVSKTGTGSGSLTSSPAGISCGSDCSETYPAGTAVTLTAAASSGSTFTGWSGGGCSGTGSCVVSMTADISVSANFDIQTSTYTLSVNKTGTGIGTVTSTPTGINCGSDCSESYSSGTVVTLTASPASGSVFSGWGGSCSGTGACNVTMSATKTVTATFDVTNPGDVIFADGFESANLTGWTSCTTDGGDLSATSAAKLSGSYGMQAVLDDSVAIFCMSDHPNAETRYRSRFYFDPNSIGMVSGDAHMMFRGYTGTSTVVLRVEFGRAASGYQIRAALMNDGSTWTQTNWFPITDAYHSVELDWRAATGAGANNGGLTFWIDGSQQAELTGVDNDTRRIDRIQLGATTGLDTGTRGTYYFDAFESRRQTYIGP